MYYKYTLNGGNLLRVVFIISKNGQIALLNSKSVGNTRMIELVNVYSIASVQEPLSGPTVLQ